MVKIMVIMMRETKVQSIKQVVRDKFSDQIMARGSRFPFVSFNRKEIQISDRPYKKTIVNLFNSPLTYGHNVLVEMFLHLYFSGPSFWPLLQSYSTLE